MFVGRVVGEMFDQEFIRQVAGQVADVIVSKLNKPSVEKRYFTIQQASEYTSYTVAALRSCIQQKQFPVTGHGTTLRIDKQDLDYWLASLKR